MSAVEQFYGTEEEGFEELVEKNLEDHLDNDDDDGEFGLLSDGEDDSTQADESQDLAAMKREQRLETVMAMTRNPIISAKNTLQKDEKAVYKRIHMLCAALGGFDPAPPNQYILGVEAQGCLRDIKNLLKSVDEAKNVWTVATACCDTGLLINDLIPIMVQYGSMDTKTLSSERMSIILLTLEILVKLMTPLRLNADDKEAKLYSYNKLRKAQIEYKYHLLTYKKGKIFKYIIALMIPILGLNLDQIVRRDNVILNLCLTLFVNVLRIQPSDAKTTKKNKQNIVHVFDALPQCLSKEDVSIDAVMKVFKHYNVIAIVQTISSNMSKHFDTTIFGAACLDFYYYLFLRLDPKLLLAPKPTERHTAPVNPTNGAAIPGINTSISANEAAPNVSTVNSKLENLMKKENINKRELFSKNSTRHANFGSLINVRSKTTSRIISGQKNLLNNNMFEVLESSSTVTGAIKNIRINDKSKYNENENMELYQLNADSVEIISDFVEGFIRNGYVTLLGEIYKKIIQDKDYDVQDFTFHYHYYFVMHWVFTYERAYQATKPREFNTIKRYRSLFYIFDLPVINVLMSDIILKFSEKKEYDMLIITTSVLQELLLASMLMHSYSKLDTTPLLNDEKTTLKTIIVRSEQTMRMIFSSTRDIESLLRIPQNAHKKTYTYAHHMVDFVGTLFKVLDYIVHLKYPLVLAPSEVQIDGSIADETDRQVFIKKLRKYKVTDHKICNKFKDILFSDKTVDTHVWLFYQFKYVEEKKIKKCISYFGKLVQHDKANILKLIRLDFMFALHEFRNASVSPLLKKEYVDLLNYYMHHLHKIYTNTPMILLEAMFFSSNLDTALIDYYMTGDAMTDRRLTSKEKIVKSNHDVAFKDEHISQQQKISSIVSYFYYKDDVKIVNLFVQYIQQWFHELTGTVTEDMVKITHLNSFKLDGYCASRFRTDPYFRLLCKSGNVISSSLVVRDSEILKELKRQIELALETPLEPEDLENVFLDPNVNKKRRKERADDEDGAGDGFDDIEGDSYDSDDQNNGYGDEGINDNDDLADSGDEQQDDLELLEAQLARSEKRVKGKVFKKTADGKLVQMGARKRQRKEKSEKLSRTSKKRVTKKRRIVQDDDLDLSEAEIQRRNHLSADLIVESDDDDEKDAAFFAREEKLRQLLQKRHGKITKAQYDSLMNDSLDLDDVSDLDDKLFDSEIHTQEDQEDQEDQDKILNPDRVEVGEFDESEDDDSTQASDNSSGDESASDEADTDDNSVMEEFDNSILEKSHGSDTPVTDDLVSGDLKQITSHPILTQHEATHPEPVVDMFANLRKIHQTLNSD